LSSSWELLYFLVDELLTVFSFACIVQIQELEMQHSAVLSELNTIRKAIAEDNDVLISKGTKGVKSVQELFSK